MPSSMMGGRVLIVSMTVPYQKCTNGQEEAKIKVIHNHPAWLVGLGVDKKTFIGMSDAAVDFDDCVKVTVDEHDRHLHHAFCKERLWPLLHYSIWDKPLLDVSLESSLYRGFEAVNERFCEAVLREYKADDLVIVIGYHLASLSGLLKKHHSTIPIAFFLKCPVSSSEYIKCLPQAKQVVRGALGANLVIVQSDSFARHCASFCLRLLNMEKEQVVVNGSMRIIDNDGEVDVVLATRWLGVDVERAREMRTSYAVLEKVNELYKLFGTETKVMLGIDGADQLRGVKHKLDAFRLFLETWPEFIGTAIEDKETEMRVSELVNSINQQFGSLSYTPVHYHQRHIGEDEYFALLTTASVYVNTVERDAIPSVCLDFVICQEGRDEEQCGVLVLSELTALADYLPSALTKVAEALKGAISMKASERRTVTLEMMNTICESDAKKWAPQVLPQLQSMLTPKTPLLEKTVFKERYQQAHRRIFFLDYDGTLTPIVTCPQDAVPSRRCLDILSQLTDDPRNQVYVISGRTQASLEEFLGCVPKLGLSAEHGSFLRACKSDHWATTVSPPSTSSWRDQALSVFHHYTDRTPGSHIEAKELSVTWHYRQADPDYGTFQAADCVESLEGVLEGGRVDILRGKKNIEVRLAAVNKGHIVRSILAEAHHQHDFVVCIGDDTTDEDMFAVLADDSAMTCIVGAANKKTAARFHVPNCEYLLSLLQFALL